MDAYRVDIRIMTFHSGYNFFSLQVPKRDCFIVATREKLQAHRMEFNTIHTFVVTLELEVILLGGFLIECSETNRAISTTCC